MNLSSRQYIFIGATVAVFSLISFLYFRYPFYQIPLFGSARVVVSLHDDGFYPKKITVEKGSVITFISKTGRPFWPASNLHPTHEIYPPFDSRKPIAPDDSWSFSFNEQGKWNYHDHLHANQTGTIIVTAGDGQPWDAAQTALVCISKELSKKQQCWDEQLEAILADKGLDAAFRLFIELYKTEPSIAKGCHGWGHVLGKSAYQLFADKKDFTIPNEAAYCGYGFYHGFLEELLRKTGNPRGALVFCKYASERVDAIHKGSVYINCVHGIGHGSTAGAAELPSNQGDTDQVLAVGKRYCGIITDKPEELQPCWEGVFNELQQNINFTKNGFSYDLINHDFFGICRRQEDKYKKACYFEFIGLIAQFTGRNFQKAANMVLTDISNRQMTPYLMIKLMADFMQDDIVHPTYDKNVLDCRALPVYLHDSCFTGILVGFIVHGEPEREYVKGLEFCRSDILISAERTQCYQHLLGNFASMYSSEKLASICSTIESAYQYACQAP